MITRFDVFATWEDMEVHFGLENEHCYTEALKLLKQMKADGFTPRPMKSHQTHRAGADATPGAQKLCPVHKVAMRSHSNERGEWFSHKLADGTWCSGEQK